MSCFIPLLRRHQGGERRLRAARQTELSLCHCFLEPDVRPRPQATLTRRFYLAEWLVCTTELIFVAMQNEDVTDKKGWSVAVATRNVQQNTSAGNKTRLLYIILMHFDTITLLLILSNFINGMSTHIIHVLTVLAVACTLFGGLLSKDGHY